MKSENIRVAIVHSRQFSTFYEPTMPNRRAGTNKGSASIFPELSARNLQYRKFDMNE